MTWSHYLAKQGCKPCVGRACVVNVLSLGTPLILPEAERRQNQQLELRQTPCTEEGCLNRWLLHHQEHHQTVPQAGGDLGVQERTWSHYLAKQDRKPWAGRVCVVSLLSLGTPQTLREVGRRLKQ